MKWYGCFKISLFTDRAERSAYSTAPALSGDEGWVHTRSFAELLCLGCMIVFTQKTFLLRLCCGTAASCKILFNTGMPLGLHGGVVVRIVASQLEGSRFNSQLGPVCVQFACSSHVLPPSKRMHVRLIGVSKSSLGMNVCEWLFVSVWPCDILECTLPLAQRDGIGSSPSMDVIIISYHAITAEIN